MNSVTQQQQQLYQQQSTENSKLKMIDSLINVSRSPINCPVSKCNKTVGITSILAHFLRDHRGEMNRIELEEILSDQRSILSFSESEINDKGNCCLGILAYGGKNCGDESSRPGKTGLCCSNSFLPEKISYYVNHLPILIMGCKTKLNDFVPNMKFKTTPEDNSKDVIILWLATIETKKPIYCTLTVFDQEATSSRSSIIKVRNLKFSQKPSEFISNDMNYLMLTRGDLNILSKGGDNFIDIETFIHEVDD